MRARPSWGRGTLGEADVVATPQRRVTRKQEQEDHMRMSRTVVLVVGLFLMASAWASQPGQPLDCSDWVFLRPGLGCSEVVPYPCPNVGSGGGDDFSLCIVSTDNR